MWAGMAISKAGETAKGEASCANALPSATGVEGLGLTPSNSWGSSLEMVAVGAWQHLLGGGGTEDCERAPLRSPHKPSAFDPATVSYTFL